MLVSGPFIRGFNLGVSIFAELRALFLVGKRKDKCSALFLRCSLSLLPLIDKSYPLGSG